MLMSCEAGREKKNRESLLCVILKDIVGCFLIVSRLIDSNTKIS
jgi:hypothetical protein